jgi:hypothetical protein
VKEHEENLSRVDRERPSEGQDLPRSSNVPSSWFGEEKPYEGICDGCAQSESECLCDVNLDDVLDCASPFHPGCRKCEAR